ncbi:MAG: hypothetical protein ABIP74_01255 [Candidatus Saccharimonas sp.]
MTHLSAHGNHMALQHALADNLRNFVRLGEDAKQDTAPDYVQRWARIFAESLRNYANLIPLLEREYFSDGDLANIVTMINQAQGGLLIWLMMPRP